MSNEFENINKNGWYEGYYWIAGRIAVTSTFHYNWMAGLQYILQQSSGNKFDRNILELMTGHIKPTQGTIEGFYWTERILKDGW